MHNHGQFMVKALYDKDTFTLTYVVFDPETKDACVIDSVLDFDPASGQYSYTSAHELLEFLETEKLKVHYILETHAHADHLSASVFLKEKLGGAKVAIGKNITLVQDVFSKLFNLPVATDGSQFDVLFEDGQVVEAGSLSFKVIFTPGHTPACTSLYFAGDKPENGAVFTGDAIFMPDYGTGRCDFPKGCAEDLYNSITNKLYTLDDETKVYVGHDYQPGGRELLYQSTIGAEKKENIRLKGDTSKEDFVKFRRERDATLNAPRLLLPSIQVNIAAGHFPEQEENGMSYLKTPLREKLS